MILSFLAALAISLYVASTTAHSWIEAAYRIDASTRKFVGAPGYPRGGNFRRLSAETGLTDAEYVYRIPENGQYTGQENINQRPVEANRPDETLEASPGDRIAVLHLENGHVSYPQEGRPLNGGTVYIYGTSQPTDADKLTDVHLAWNEAGTGGDGRGRLLATRNFDDGQCYEGNPSSQVATTRAAAVGSDASTSMDCQSEIQLPDDLAVGSNYTIYWYWDWPLLDTAKIDMDGTKQGLYPWMGTFVQGEEDPRGFTADMIASNESYASTMDISIVEKSDYASQSLPADEAALSAVYRTAIEAQMKTAFDVKVPVIEPVGSGGGSDTTTSPAATGTTAATTPTTPTTPVQATPTDVVSAATVTVTQTVTAPAQTSVAQAEAAAPVTVTTTVTEPCHESVTTPTSTQTVIEMETQYATVYVDETTTAMATPTARRIRRSDWTFGTS
ncbi:hypothetical protein GMORB2_3981 [Geosmithia morbida]|uniref:DUF7492 domain-containing protein n=1 Tax=Geosmithia morbida TaxID=1094350 RepID=A0A9P4YZ16_9HYPO|nr:uncharacterized protein GMORB2_3981 [Geosmithia morbida]KAF4125142.1 hypothetical protein GMORB2_3981 [Geosmithia morbida]